MAIKLKNLSKLFEDGRTRTIIFLTVGVLLVGIFIGISRITRTNKEVPTNISLEHTPNVKSIPGGFGKAASPEYAKLQDLQNSNQAKEAALEGTSSIPTIVRASSFDENLTKKAGSENCCCDNAGAGDAVGKFVYDAQGRLIGTVGEKKSRPGTLVYDSKGNLIGVVSEDGLVRDAKGDVVGTAGADGYVRDSTGKVIGQTGSSQVGDPVYDATGKLIGRIESDGKVYDAKGNLVNQRVYDALGKLIGTVAADGKVYDAKGNLVGKGGDDGKVYDAKGNLVGTVTADGKLYDAQGKLIGAVGADGVVRDVRGNIIGKVGNFAAGDPVYGADGRLVGIIGKDGKVRDTQGNIVAEVQPDGTIVDKSGNVIGKARTRFDKAPVYNLQGKLIGEISPLGEGKDFKGRAMHTIVTTANGDGTAPVTGQIGGSAISGSTGVNGITPGVVAGGVPFDNNRSNPELQMLLQKQMSQISQQKADQLKTQMQSAMTTQANQLLTSWGSPIQAYSQGNQEEKGNSITKNGDSNEDKDHNKKLPSEVKAGTIMYASLLTAVNSDEPGPVLALINEGKFKGAKLIGALTRQDQKVMLSFNIMTMDSVPRSIPVDIVAIDPNTARTAFSSYTDNHYLLRYGTAMAAAFAQGYGQAIQSSGSTTTTSLLGTTTSYPTLTARQQVYTALGNVGNKLGSAMSNYFSILPTVYVYSGTSLGVLFLKDLPILSSFQ